MNDARRDHAGGECEGGEIDTDVAEEEEGGAR